MVQLIYGLKHEAWIPTSKGKIIGEVYRDAIGRRWLRAADGVADTIEDSSTARTCGYITEQSVEEIIQSVHSKEIISHRKKVFSRI